MEKLIKIQVYRKAADYDNHKMFNHNVEKLILYAETLEIDLFVPKYVRDNSLVITDWESGSRYDVGFSIRIDTLKKAVNEADAWYEMLYEEGIRWWTNRVTAVTLFFYCLFKIWYWLLHWNAAALNY